jgi:cytochrome oxidase assembly protein ShyY1
MDEAWEILEEIRMAGKDVLIARGWLLYERGDPESLQ